MNKLFKLVDADNTSWNDGKILVGSDAEIDGMEFVKLLDGTLLVLDRFDELTSVVKPAGKVTLNDVVANFTRGKAYVVDSAWQSDQAKYYLLKNDLGRDDYLKADRFSAPVVAQATDGVANSAFGYAKCTSNHKGGYLKLVKRITEGNVYPLTRSWDSHPTVAFIMNDEGREEDFVKARLQKVVAQTTNVTWVPA